MTSFDYVVSSWSFDPFSPSEVGGIVDDAGDSCVSISGMENDSDVIVFLMKSGLFSLDNEPTGVSIAYPEAGQ